MARVALEQVQPLATVVARHPTMAPALEQLVALAGLSEAGAAWLPVQTRSKFATAVLRRSDASLIGFIDVDPY